MYVPPHFAVSDQAQLHDFIGRYSFGLLVSQVGGVPFASHLPLLLDRTAGPHGTLFGHMARANPHWRELANQPALAVFSGPHAYVSPTWYEAENVVPTWNYVAVHAYGRAEIVDDQAALLDIVQRSVAVYEAAMPRPWTFDGSSPYAGRQLGAIVGFRIEVERLEGKWKLNQNQPVERRRKVADILGGQSGDAPRAVAEMMRAMMAARE
jgi:transcriptional regulator